MERIEKTVFISYRRTNISWALAIFQNLQHHGYDLFFDFDGLASGDFERVIVENIKARAHFLVLLTPTALERCSAPQDWLRREIETAIASNRNIVPILLDGFDFGRPEIASQLTGKLAALRNYNALTTPAAYFSESMDRLRTRFLNVPLNAVLHPVSTFAQQVTEKQVAAAYAAPSIPELKLSAQQYLELGNAALSKDDAEAVRWYRKAADAANAPGMTNLGFTYESGRGGLPKDDTQAVYWYRKAADAGEPQGMSNFGLMHQNGRGGLPKDDAQAVFWYRKAADAGNADGMTNLGFMYENGRGGLPKDDAQAVYWYRKAADVGNPQGMKNLGFMYENGRGGLPKDDAQAVFWYRKAADAANAQGITNLGAMYRDGRGGLPNDDFKAVQLFKRSADFAEPGGMANLAFMLEQGRGGLPKDIVQAIGWYRKAAEAGNDYSKNALKRLGRG